MEDRRFRNRLVAVLCEEWEKATPGPLPSEAIYERLVGEDARGVEEHPFTQEVQEGSERRPWWRMVFGG